MFRMSRHKTSTFQQSTKTCSSASSTASTCLPAKEGPGPPMYLQSMPEGSVGSECRAHLLLVLPSKEHLAVDQREASQVNFWSESLICHLKWRPWRRLKPCSYCGTTWRWWSTATRSCSLGPWGASWLPKYNYNQSLSLFHCSSFYGFIGKINI